MAESPISSVVQKARDAGFFVVSIIPAEFIFIPSLSQQSPCTFLTLSA